eukprot:15133229-Heterocapsa_arctica.AAC.1
MPKAKPNHHIPADWLLERDQWLNIDGKPDMTSLEEDVLEAEHVAAQAEPYICRWHGAELEGS